MSGAVALVDPTLDRLASREDLLNVLKKLGVIETMGDVGQRTPAIARNEAEDAGHPRRKPADGHVAVEKDRRDLCALVQVPKIGIGTVELINLNRQLVIDGLQLLVDRLQLLLRCLQLLVGGLQLLVDGNYLLITGF